jgi:hypothetical protein
MTDQILAKTSPATARNPLMILVSDAVLIAIVSALISLAILKFGAPFLTPQRESVAFANVEALTQEFMMDLTTKAATGQMPAAEMSAKTAQFNYEMKRQLAHFASSGLIVLRSDTVVAAPDEIEDLTGKLRESLAASGFLGAKSAVAPLPAASPALPAASSN